MRRNFAAMKMIRNMLFQPIGSLSKELAPYDPIDKPVLCYEQMLYLVGLSGTILVKIVDLFVKSASFWSPLHIIALLFVILALLIATFNLLFPPRFSASRLVLIISNTIWLLVLISPR